MNLLLLAGTVALGLYGLVLLLLATAHLLRREDAVIYETLPGVSVLVCARNEEGDLPGCLRSILSQDYPHGKLELIVVDDASDDATGTVAESILRDSGCRYRVIRNSVRQGKKRSIDRAVQMAQGEVIVLRDADTTTGSPQWLKGLVSRLQGNTALIGAPVWPAPRPGFLPALQFLESHLLQLVASGSASLGLPFLCSAANLAFRRNVFLQAAPYQDNLNVDSGDDVFLLNAVKRIPGQKIRILNAASLGVETRPETTVSGLLRQRARWVGKTRYNPDPLNAFLALLILLVNLLCLAAPFLAVFTDARWWFFFFGKLGIDLILLLLTPAWRNSGGRWNYVWLLLPVYPLYALAVALRTAGKNPWSPHTSP